MAPDGHGHIVSGHMYSMWTHVNVRPHKYVDTCTCIATRGHICTQACEHGHMCWRHSVPFSQMILSVKNLQAYFQLKSKEGGLFHFQKSSCNLRVHTLFMLGNLAPAQTKNYKDEHKGWTLKLFLTDCRAIFSKKNWTETLSRKIWAPFVHNPMGYPLSHKWYHNSH